MTPKVYLYRRVVRAKLYIDDHYAMPLDLDAIADEAALSKFHFLRLFKMMVGRTPHQYLMHVRLEKACDKLRRGDLVSTTCIHVGFESLTSFASLFKKKYGLSPSNWQRNVLDRMHSIKNQPLHHIPECFATAQGWKEKAILDK